MRKERRRTKTKTRRQLSGWRGPDDKGEGVLWNSLGYVVGAAGVLGQTGEDKGRKNCEIARGRSGAKTMVYTDFRDVMMGFPMA